MEVDVERAENESFADLYRAAAPELGIELLELGEVACGAVRGFSLEDLQPGDGADEQGTAMAGGRRTRPGGPCPGV